MNNLQSEIINKIAAKYAEIAIIANEAVKNDPFVFNDIKNIEVIVNGDELRHFRMAIINGKYESTIDLQITRCNQKLGKVLKNTGFEL